VLGRGSFDTTLTPPRTQSCIKHRATRGIAGAEGHRRGTRKHRGGVLLDGSPQDGFCGVLIELVAVGESYAVVETAAGSGNRLRFRSRSQALARSWSMSVPSRTPAGGGSATLSERRRPRPRARTILWRRQDAQARYRPSYTTPPNYGDGNAA
jgi:hypothetical protein